MNADAEAEEIRGAIDKGTSGVMRAADSAQRREAAEIAEIWREMGAVELEVRIDNTSDRALMTIHVNSY